MSENPSEINDMNNTKVYCRFRPMTKKESDFSPEQISSISSSTILNLTTAKQKNIFSFNFDHIFPPNSSQEEIYNICARNSVENFLLGYNSSIIIHGEKGSGKSYTMNGKISDNNLKGIIPRVIKDLFEFIFDNENLEFIIKVSMVDIYKDKIKDLITNNDININFDDENKKIDFEGIYEKYINSENELLNILEKGINNKAKLEYNINLNGKFSKSNMIFILKLIQNNKKEGFFTNSELIFIDTSGEENLFSNNNNIYNIFQKILYGNYKTNIIITCSPSIYNQEITLLFLRFGEKMKKIKNNAKINKELSYDKLKEKLKEYEYKIKEFENFGKSKKYENNNNIDLNTDETYKLIFDLIEKEKNIENKENILENIYNLKDKYNFIIENLNNKIKNLEHNIKINNEIKSKLQKTLISQQTINIQNNNIIEEFTEFISDLNKSKEINSKYISELEIKLNNYKKNNTKTIFEISNSKNNIISFNVLNLVKEIELSYNNNINNIRNNSEEIKSDRYAQTDINQVKIEKIESDYDNDIKYLSFCLEENKDIILELKKEILSLQNKNKILENNALLNERKIRDKNLILENDILDLKKKYEDSQVKRLILEDELRKLNKIITNKKMNLLNIKNESINKSINKSIGTPKNIIKIMAVNED